MKIFSGGKNTTITLTMNSCFCLLFLFMNIKLRTISSSYILALFPTLRILFLSKLIVQFHTPLHALTHRLQAVYPFTVLHPSSPLNHRRAIYTPVSLHVQMYVRMRVHGCADTRTGICGCRCNRVSTRKYTHVPVYLRVMGGLMQACASLCLNNVSYKIKSEAQNPKQA